MDSCSDNSFELINKYKRELIEKTNIETSPDEMRVIDNILFRFWQMGWLDTLEQTREQAEKFQWVPVSDRTPDDYGAVLLQYSNRRWLETEKRETLDIGYFDAFGNEELREGCEKFRGEVVAWMPLPEPYKRSERK